MRFIKGSIIDANDSCYKYLANNPKYYNWVDPIEYNDLGQKVNDGSYQVMQTFDIEIFDNFFTICRS